MNTTTDPNVTRLYEIAYKSLSKKFTKNFGIIQPIRAIVNTVKFDTQYPDPFKEHTRCLLAIAHDNTNWLVNADQKSLHQNFKDKADVVGYFAAWYDENIHDVLISVSFCRPKDWEKFDKNFGRALAINKLDDLCASYVLSKIDLYKELDSFIPSKTMDEYFEFDVIPAYKFGDTTTTIVYQYMYTIREQLEYFIKRCERYYKIYRKNK